jgi:hypothetical protein
VQGRYTTFPARHLDRPASTTIQAALMRALERAWHDPDHKIHERFNAAPMPGATRASSTRPNQKD